MFNFLTLLNATFKTSLPLLTLFLFCSPAFSLGNDYFYLTDQRADNEISEQSFLYINGHLAKVLRLSKMQTKIEEKIFLPNGVQDVTYALCGEITLLEHNKITKHYINNEGFLYAPQHRHYNALATQNFKNFVLYDENDPAASLYSNTESNLCHFASS